MLPLRQGLPQRQTHDDLRHGTTTLFAALEVATGKITADACYPRHSNVEFLAFLKKVARAHPRVKLHVVVDNYAAHTRPDVRVWLDHNKRVRLRVDYHIECASCASREKGMKGAPGCSSFPARSC